MGRSTPTTAFNDTLHIQYRHIEHMHEGVYGLINSYHSF